MYVNEVLDFINDREYPNEEVIAGGSAKSKRLDRDFLEALESSNGGMAGVKEVALRNGTAISKLLLAKWLATEYRFMYVRPNARSYNSWPWKEIESLTIVGISHLGLARRARLTIAAGAQHDFLITRKSATVLVEIAASHIR